MLEVIVTLTKVKYTSLHWIDTKTKADNITANEVYECIGEDTTTPARPQIAVEHRAPGVGSANTGRELTREQIPITPPPKVGPQFRPEQPPRLTITVQGEEFEVPTATNVHSDRYVFPFLTHRPEGSFSPLTAANPTGELRRLRD